MSKRGGGDAGEISQSVEESNELRAKLGIKPLKEGGRASDPVGSSKNPVDIHAKNAAESSKGPSEGDVKRRTAAAKNKKDHEEMTAGEGLGDILKREEAGKSGAAEWIARSRNADGTMKGQGVAAASAAAAASDSKKRKAKDAGGDTVPAMKVRHDAKDLEDGTEVTMVLSDKPILTKDGGIDDSRDELSNVRMSDAERAKHNDEIRKQVEYDPTKEGQDILEKYDDLKTGPKGFLIGGTTMGVIEETDPEKKLSILMALTEKQSLESRHRMQSDYYTAEEMNKFRKPPKKKTKRRKDDKGGGDKEDHIGGSAPTGTALAGRPADAGSDEEDPELYEQLSKQRRLVRRSDAGSVRKGEAALAAVSERISSIDAEKPAEDVEKQLTGGALAKASKDPAENIAMTATTEFCNVVQTPLEKEDTLKHESFRGSTLYKKQAAQRKGLKMRSNRTAAEAADLEDLANVADREEEIANLQEESLDLSCASGLAYLRARSQIGGDQDSHKNRKSDNRPLEMSTLDGDIKLEYRDDFGRVQTPKEAFRAISWKFHGKVPGRKNMERRLLRLEHEMRLKAMDPISELPTLRALRHVQTSDAKPYMVLSGANEK